MPKTYFMKNRGFTIIEMLVAMAVFSLVIGTTIGIFVWAVKAQRRALAHQQLLDSTSYIMEYMSRAIRMARKDDLDGDCLIGTKVNYEITHGGQGLKFKNYDNECQEFYLLDGRLRENIDGIDDLPLTASNFTVNSFKIDPSDSWDQDDTDQPRVTIYLEIQPKGTDEPKIKLQTTISQRNLDVQY